MEIQEAKKELGKILDYYRKYIHDIGYPPHKAVEHAIRDYLIEEYYETNNEKTPGQS